MNQLTPEQLDMIKRLQPLFREKMGEWQKGDSYYVPNPHKREDIKPLYYFGCGTYWGIEFKDVPTNAIRIPKPIDWQNPERGCWGMITGEKRLSYFNDLLSISGCYAHRVDHYYTKGKKTHDWHLITDDPFTALLKALCEQENL